MAGESSGVIVKAVGAGGQTVEAVQIGSRAGTKTGGAIGDQKRAGVARSSAALADAVDGDEASSHAGEVAPAAVQDVTGLAECAGD